MPVTNARAGLVRQVSAGEYRLSGEDGVWTILRENNLWNAYNRDGVYCRAASGKATPEEAITAVVGGPEGAARAA